MNRISQLFSRLRGEKKKALVAYLCVGDPNPEASLDLALAYADAGADLLEFGVPFSDPTADGPLIARASQRALRRGGGLTETLRVASLFRAKSDVPVVLFGYYNPLFVRGEKESALLAKDAGVDGLLVVDLPLEEGLTLRQEAASRDLCVIPLLAPTSAPDRAEKLRQSASPSGASPGFIYYVSVTGVTGSSVAPLAEASVRAGEMGKLTGLPVVVGFGIDSAAKAKMAARHTNGIVIGSALVSLLEAGGLAQSALLVREIRAGLDET